MKFNDLSHARRNSSLKSKLPRHRLTASAGNDNTANQADDKTVNMDLKGMFPVPIYKPLSLTARLRKFLSNCQNTDIGTPAPENHIISEANIRATISKISWPLRCYVIAPSINLRHTTYRLDIEARWTRRHTAQSTIRSNKIQNSYKAHRTSSPANMTFSHRAPNLIGTCTRQLLHWLCVLVAMQIALYVWKVPTLSRH